MKKLCILVVSVPLVLTASPADATVIWQFNYTDPSGVGFNATGQLGADRKQAVNEAAAVLSNIFSAYSATIQLDVDGAETNNNTLAAAASHLNSSLAAGFGNRVDVGRNILGEADPSPSAADGSITWNFEDFTWDLDDNVDPNQFDFKSTLIHELLRRCLTTILKGPP
jgi:hypothetical protein